MKLDCKRVLRERERATQRAERGQERKREGERDLPLMIRLIILCLVGVHAQLLLRTTST